jgi:hypothetical protein
MNTSRSFAVETLLNPEPERPQFPSFVPLLPVYSVYVGNSIPIPEKYVPESLCLFDEETQNPVDICYHPSNHSRWGRIPLVAGQKNTDSVIITCNIRHKIGAFKNIPNFLIAYELADAPGQWAYKRIRIYGSRSKSRQRITK